MNSQGNKIHCFGDSWAYGSELPSGGRPFVHWTAATLGMDYENHGEEGASMGMILFRLMEHIKSIGRDDIVLVVVPPDVRWYDQDEERGFYSLMNFQKGYKESLNNKTVEWFKYHHSLFIFAIQKTLDDIGCRYVLAHNYGQLPGDDYNFNVDYGKFLSDKDLTTLLNSPKSRWQSYQLEVDGPPGGQGDDGNEFFKGCDRHPNESGHKRIAELIVEYLNAK